MLGFFPTPFDDECFYSLCARYAEIVNYPCHEKAIAELFNSRSLSIAVDLPSSLNKFNEKLGIQDKFSTQRIIEKHSLFPYYSPFLPKERATKLVSEMKFSTGEAVHKISGITAASISKPNKLKFCPSCALEEIDNSGILYWHRLHQLAGVFVCPKHLCFLENTLADLTQNPYKAKLLYPQDYISLVSPRSVDLSNRSHQILISIAYDSQWLLNTNNKCLGYANLEKIYMNILKDRGSATHTETINLTVLRKQFRDYYNSELLDLLQCNFDENKEYQWIARIIPHLRAEKVHHPLRHLLLIRMLGYTPETFFSYSLKETKKLRSDEKPYFIKGPYPCLNPVCKDFKKLKIESYVIKPSFKKRGNKTIHITCKCGFAYYRNGPDMTHEDIYRKELTANFGELWEKELAKLWRNEELCISTISKRLGVCSNTIKSRALAVGLKFPRKGPNNTLITANTQIQKQIRRNYLTKKNKQQLKEKKIDRYREKWLSVREKNPTAKRSELEKIASKISRWLKIHDHKWFYANQPMAWKRTESARQIDWSIRDNECADEVKLIAKGIKEHTGKPVWVKPGSIAKQFKNRDWITHSKYQRKMPLTLKAINEVSESRIDFNLRRIVWAVHSIKEDGSSYAFSSVGHRAGVSWNLWQVPEIKQAIENGIEEIKVHRDVI